MSGENLKLILLSKMKLKNFIHKLADRMTGHSHARFFLFYMLPFLYCIGNGFFIFAGIMFLSFVSIIMCSLLIKYNDAKLDCLSDREKKKNERDKKRNKNTTACQFLAFFNI